MTVLKALQNNNWVSHVCPLLTSEKIHEFVTLWQEIRLLPRDEGADDEIIWRWTTNGEYTTSSAYRIQFMGHFKKMSITPIWKAKAEPKCKIFAWILLHRKILSADNLERRGWPHDPLCKMCNSAPETPAHLCKDCPYTSAVWTHVVRWLIFNNCRPVPQQAQFTDGGKCAEKFLVRNKNPPLMVS